MEPRLLGVETEYAISGPAPHGQLISALVRVARKQLVNLPGGRPGDLFLANGGRFYIDSGGHPEFCTPECSDPAEAVRYVLAGERILETLRDRIEEEDPELRGTTLFKGNVDYVSGTTWGCHESYLTRREPRFFQAELIPHLVSRIVYAGAGGLCPRSGRLEISLSPRAGFLEQVSSSQSTEGRGIFHTKNEPLARRGFHRLHVLCGESLCSELASWLKLGTTALVVAMIEAGLDPGAGARPCDPLAALRTFAADPSCTARVEVERGEPLGAVEIQRRYLEAAEAQLGAAVLPPWAGEVCREWRAMLDRIERGPQAVQATLDWAIKRALFMRHAERRGFSWDSLAPWGRVIGVINDALDGVPQRGPIPVETVLASPNLIPNVIDSLGSELAELGLSWDGLRPVVDLRKELFELDVRFGELHERGIFRALDRRGVLAHRAPRVGEVDQARDQGPTLGRARLRAEAVRAHAGERGYHCDWQAVWDHARRRVLKLTDPFAAEATWKEYTSRDWITQMVALEE